jgi:hypothetical protein
MLYMWYFWVWNWTKKGWFTIMFMLTLLIELCEFCMKEVYKCRDWRMMRWDEEWIKAQAWGCPCHPKKYPRVKSVKAWGCPRGTPSSSAKIRSPFNTLYFYWFIFYAFFLERPYFCFQFSLILFSAINGWTPTNFFWRRCSSFFICQEQSIFHSYRSTSVLFF